MSPSAIGFAFNLNFVHPTVPGCCRTLMPGVATVVAEVPHDTARAIISLLYSGALRRY